MSKDEGAKVPKTIAGVKIPKALRKSGLLDALITTPVGRAVVAKASAAAVEAGLAVLLEWASSEDSLDGEHAEDLDVSKEAPATSETGETSSATDNTDGVKAKVSGKRKPGRKKAELPLTDR